MAVRDFAGFDAETDEFLGFTDSLAHAKVLAKRHGSPVVIFRYSNTFE